MLRNAGLCRDCKKECVEIKADTTILIQCPSCDGCGCEHCTNGEITITECPNKTCEDLIPAIELSDFFHDKQMPIAGGVLDQSAWFLNFARRLKYEDAAVKSQS